MLNLFEHLIFWHWLLFAAVLFIFELVTGSGFLFWTGISATIVGVFLWIFPDVGWAMQLVGFAVLGIISAVLWWLYLKRHPIKTDRPLLNKRSEQYVGRVFTLDAPIVNGLGKIHVDDSMWRVRCQDMPAGTRVRIIGVDGVILIGEKADPS